MIKKIKKLFKPEYMVRPVVHKTYSGMIFSLLICFAWYRLIDRGVMGLDFVFTIMVVFMLALAWMNYLYLDDVRIGHLMMGWTKKKKRNMAPSYKDIADFADEEVIDYGELEDDERAVVRLFANLIDALIYVILTLIFTFK